jgi:hypothetical protein
MNMTNYWKISFMFGALIEIIPFTLLFIPSLSGQWGPGGPQTTFIAIIGYLGMILNLPTILLVFLFELSKINSYVAMPCFYLLQTSFWACIIYLYFKRKHRLTSGSS